MQCLSPPSTHVPCDYTAQELESIDPDIRYIFACDEAQAATRRDCQVRYHGTLEYFTVYPKSSREIANNEHLWRIVRDSSFRSAEWTKEMPLLRAHESSRPSQRIAIPFALAIPEKLFVYLQSVSLDSMHESVLCMLADAARSEEHDGLQAMRNELAPEIWEQLCEILRYGRRKKRRKGARSSSLVATLSRQTQGETTPTTTLTPSPSPWTVIHTQKSEESSMFASFMLDQALQKAHEHDYWRIGIAGATFEYLSSSELQTGRPASVLHENEKAKLFHRLFEDWRIYSCMGGQEDTSLSISSPSVDPSGASRQPNQPSQPVVHTERMNVLESMMKLVVEKRQAATWERANAVMASFNEGGSFFGTLPRQVVKNCILPKVVLEETRVPTQQMSIAMLQTLNVEPAEAEARELGREEEGIGGGAIG